MCLVEVKGAPKPVASCAWAVRDCRPGPERRAAGRQHQDADGQEGARRGDGVPPHQPPARLPDLRPGRPVRPAGPGDGLRRRHLALPREQARGRRQVSRPADQDRHEPVHPLHPLRPLHHRGGRRRGSRRDLARRGHGDHELSREGARLRAAGQRRRSLPGRRAHPQARGLQLPALGADARPSPST